MSPSVVRVLPERVSPARSSDIIMEEMNYRVEVGDGAASHDLNCEVSWPSNGEVAGGLGYERGGGGEE